MKKTVDFIMHVISKMIVLFIVLSIFNTFIDQNVMADEVEEYAVKAAFVFNFAKFIQWPKTSFSDNNSPYQLCFIGGNAVAQQFKKFNGARDGTRTIDVHHLLSPQQCKKCNIIFISRDTSPLMLKKIISKVSGKPVLTIGETKKFTELGGVINFFLKNNRLHFEINTNAAEKQGLKMSSRLLDLAVIVDGQK